MSAKKIRTSVDYGALVDMVASETLRWPTVSLAARGIKVDADSNTWMLTAGKTSGDPFWLADRIIDYGQACEEIAPLWGRFLAGEIEAVEFEQALDRLVTRMEAVFEEMKAGPTGESGSDQGWWSPAEP